MTDIDTLRYKHVLSNGERLTLSLAFSIDLNTRDSFLERAKYMYDTMQHAIKEREAQLEKRL